jgi:PKD repeat protein
MAYVTDDGSATLTQIDLTTFTSSVVTLPAGSAPSWMIMDPDGVMGYVASQTVLYPITNLTGTPTVQQPIPGFNFSFPNFYPQLIINSDSTMLFATNTGDRSVQPVTLADQTLGVSIPVGPTPNGISITPDGSIIYVSDGNDNTIDMINPIGPTAVVVTKMPITTQNTPTDVATTPDQAPLAFFKASLVLSSLQVNFDASSSQSPTGTIANYAWNFGDGTPIFNTASPTITHQYAVPGTYVVILTVTNTAGTSTFLAFTGQIVSRNGGPTAVMTLPVTLPPYPVNNFTGSVKKCKYLNETVYSLKATWTPSQIPSVVSYLIFKNGVLEGTVPAAGPYLYETFLLSKNGASQFSIVTLYPNNVQSAPLNIRITNE